MSDNSAKAKNLLFLFIYLTINLATFSAKAEEIADNFGDDIELFEIETKTLSEKILEDINQATKTETDKLDTKKKAKPKWLQLVIRGKISEGKKIRFKNDKMFIEVGSAQQWRSIRKYLVANKKLSQDKYGNFEFGFKVPRAAEEFLIRIPLQIKSSAWLTSDYWVYLKKEKGAKSIQITKLRGKENFIRKKEIWEQTTFSYSLGRDYQSYTQKIPQINSILKFKNADSFTHYLEARSTFWENFSQSFYASFIPGKVRSSLTTTVTEPNYVYQVYGLEALLYSSSFSNRYFKPQLRLGLQYQKTPFVQRVPPAITKVISVDILLITLGLGSFYIPSKKIYYELAFRYQHPTITGKSFTTSSSRNLEFFLNGNYKLTDKYSLGLNFAMQRYDYDFDLIAGGVKHIGQHVIVNISYGLRFTYFY